MVKYITSFEKLSRVIKRMMVLSIIIVLTWSFGIRNVYAAETEEKEIKLTVTTYPFVDYGKEAKLYPGVIYPSETKGLCSVQVDIEGHAENVCIELKTMDITIAGRYDGPNHAVFEIGTLNGVDSRSVTLIDANIDGEPHLEIFVTVDGIKEAAWSCDFDTETKARAILLVDPDSDTGNDEKAFRNDLKMMEEVFQNCWYNGEPVEITSIWDPEMEEDPLFSGLPSHYFEDDALGQLTSMGIDGNDLTYVYLSAHGLNSENFAIPNDSGGIIGDVSYMALIYWLEENVPGQIVIIADACYSGGLIEEAIKQNDLLSIDSPAIYDRFVILTSVSPDTTASMWIADMDFDFERWPGGYSWFTHDIYRAGRGKEIPHMYDSIYETAKRKGVLSVELVHDVIDYWSDEGVKLFNDHIDPKVYGQQFKPLFVTNKNTRLAVAPFPINIQEGGNSGSSKDLSAALDAYGDLVTTYRKAIEGYRANGTYPKDELIDINALETQNGGGTPDDELKTGLYDLNDDGIPELFFGIYDQHHFPEHQSIWAIYTYSDGAICPVFISTSDNQDLSAEDANGMRFMSETAMEAYYFDKDDQFYVMSPNYTSLVIIPKEQAEASAPPDYLYVLNMGLDYVLEPDTEQAVHDGTIGTKLHYYDFTTVRNSTCPQGDVEQRWRQNLEQLSDSETDYSGAEADDDMETMLTGYYWYGGIQSPQIYVFSADGTFLCEGIVPGRSDLSYDRYMIITPDDFVMGGFSGTWELEGTTMYLTYDLGWTETYQYYTSDDNGPEENWPWYFYGEWEAESIVGNIYTEHQTLGRINRK